MTSNETLRAKVLAAIRAGTLPDRDPDATWGGKGCGAACAICGSRIEPEETELELEFIITRDGVNGRTEHHLHLACFSAWNSERMAQSRKGAGAPGLSVAPCDTSLASHEREAHPNAGRP